MDCSSPTQRVRSPVFVLKDVSGRGLYVEEVVYCWYIDHARPVVNLAVCFEEQLCRYRPRTPGVFTYHLLTAAIAPSIPGLFSPQAFVREVFLKGTSNMS